MANLELNKRLVKDVQKSLGFVSNDIDGIVGPKTRSAIASYQTRNNLVVTGIINQELIESLGCIDTDKSNSVYTINGIKFENHFLDKDEYIDTEINKNDYLFLHHTAGWNNPFKTIDDWNKDDRGKIGTEFVIGGQNIKTGDNSYDGRIVKAFPDGCNAYHLGSTGSQYMNIHSVGIEVCNFGFIKDGKTYVGTPALEEQIITLNQAFRGYTQWHKYSYKQLENLRYLILYIANRDNINVHEGVYQWIKKGVDNAFAFHKEAYDGKIKGLLLHCNVNKEKFDMFPQQELIDMILTL